jgi:hypothetical protein
MDRIMEAAKDPRNVKREKDRAEKRAADALEWIRDQLQGGNFKAALEVYRRFTVEQPRWSLPQPELYKLIAGLLRLRLTAEAIPFMGTYLACYTDRALAMRLKLAEALIVEKRPAQAKKVLAKLPEAVLTAPQRQLFFRLQDTADKLHQQDPYEVADKDW